MIADGLLVNAQSFLSLFELKTQGRQLLFRLVLTRFKLVNFLQHPLMLLFQFLRALSMKMDVAFVPIHLPLELHALLLRQGNLGLQFSQA